MPTVPMAELEAEPETAPMAPIVLGAPIPDPERDDAPPPEPEPEPEAAPEPEPEPEPAPVVRMPRTPVDTKYLAGLPDAEDLFDVDGDAVAGDAPRFGDRDTD